MTVKEWLNNNTEYDNAILIMGNGNQKNFWYDNDPFMNATIIKVVPSDENDYTAILYTDMVMDEE